MQHIVQFSTGIGSAEVLRRVVEQHGRKEVIALTADTLVEDEDNWRFAREVIKLIGCKWVTLSAGRTPMQIGRDVKCVPNDRMAVCSRILKRELLRKYIDQNFDPDDSIMYLGFDWTEPHRFEAAKGPWEPYTIACPLIDPPYVQKADLIEEWRKRGIEPPRLYAMGFAHANCFKSDTLFITDEGTKTLEEVLGKSIRVLGSNGVWRSAEVHSFGVQPLYELRVRRYNDEKTIFVTPDHLWPIRKQSGRTDYHWIKTDSLQVGQRLVTRYGRLIHNVKPSSVGIAAGFTFGDGCASNPSSGQNPPGQAYFCGTKDQALLPFFPFPRMTTDARGIITVNDLPRSWKQLPPRSESQSYLYGWLAGYFAADGSVNHDGSSMAITSAQRAHLEFFGDVCTQLGIATGSIRQTMRSGFGQPASALYLLSLYPSTLREDFLIIPEHRRRFLLRPEQAPRPADWTVLSVTATGRSEEVMCAVVPEGQMFTLDGNILTHNCGGACVRGGQAQWEMLLRKRPEVYAEWEAEEELSREMLGKDVSILRNRKKDAVSTVLTLRSFRENIQLQPEMFENDDWGACNCMDGADDPLPDEQVCIYCEGTGYTDNNGQNPCSHCTSEN